MMFAERIILFVINFKLTRGDYDLLSMNTNSTNEIAPIDKNTGTRGDPMTFADAEYESTRRNEVIVTARVIVPFISIALIPLFRDVFLIY